MKRILPAILAKTKKEYTQKLRSVEGHVSRVQIDIMDGLFVPNKTITLKTIAAIPSPVSKEVHMMVHAPWKYVTLARKAGAHTFIFHIEACPTPRDVIRTLNLLKKNGLRASLALNPETPLTRVLPYLDRLEHVLIMTVHPGFSGKKLLSRTLQKIRQLHKIAPKKLIEVDGGIMARNLPRLARAGAHYFVMGSAIYAAKDPPHALKTYQRILRLH